MGIICGPRRVSFAVRLRSILGIISGLGIFCAIAALYSTRRDSREGNNCSIAKRKTKQKQILKNALRFQRQPQATARSDHMQHFAGNSELFDVIVFAMFPVVLVDAYGI